MQTAVTPTTAAPTVAVPPAATPTAATPTAAPPAAAAAPAAAPKAAQPASSPYRDLFENWPSSLPKRGIVINELNDAISFRGFMVKGSLLLLERTTPDAMGGRFVVLEYSTIAALKMVDPLKTENFTPVGFVGKIGVS